MRHCVVLVLIVMGLFLLGCGDDGGNNGNVNNNNNNVAGTCGDGVVDYGEQCDEGSQNSDVLPDACRTDCRNYRCGDGVVDTGEECDDGNQQSGDGCSSTCQVEQTLCGNGVVDTGEACDDGVGNSDTVPNACRTDCTLASCGDDVVDTGEACDDGASNSDTVPNACRTDCTLPSCGDGVRDDGSPYNESCDGADFGTSTCLGLVGVVGTLGCRSDCSLDFSSCYGLEWVALQGGTYDMGSTAHGSYTLPVHVVTVPGFELTRTEVTVRQYGYCVTAGVCTTPLTGFSCNWGAAGFEDHPVNCVSWDQARVFGTWAGGRLPSESEWEYAARSQGQSIEYPWGNATATCAYAVMDEGGNGCGTDRTWPVCSKTAGNSAQGLCDLAGNVREWVEDDWHDNYTGAPTNGSAWMDSPRGSGRVLRGGSFYSGYAFYLCAAHRVDDGPSVQYPYYGFRLAR